MENALKKFAAILFILSFCSKADAREYGQFPCGYTYNAEANAWFKFHNERFHWNTSNWMCNLENAQLASPTTAAIKDAMISLMLANNNDNNKNNVYIDDETVITDNNNPHWILIHTGMRPTGNMKKDVELKDLENIGLTNAGKLKGVSQNTMLPYICYKQAPKSPQLNECGTTDHEYILDNRTNNCYKFQSQRADWFSAHNYCSLEGGHLAVINSEVEAQVIRDVFARNPSEVIPGDDWKDSAFLGFLADDKREWRSLHGHTLPEAGYDSWSEGEPNNDQGDEDCGSVGRNGKLFDDPCQRKLPFICEKRPARCIIQNQDQELLPTMNPTITILLEIRAKQYKEKGLHFDQV